MKASLVFREEKSPLLRAKFPFSLGCVPVSTGFVLGNGEDLAVHFGTFFARGPCLRLAFKPKEPENPISLVFKSGLGIWGSPNDAPLAMTAEFHIAAKGRDPILSLRVKPRLGDFGVRKNMDVLRKRQPIPAEANEQDKQRSVSLSIGSTTPQKGGNTMVSSPLPNGEGKAFHSGSPMSGEKDMVRSLSTDAGNKVIGSNFSFKIEGLDRDRKGRGDRKQKIGNPDSGMDGGGVILEVPDDILKEESKREWLKSAAALSCTVDNVIRGSKILAHSSLPLARHAMLNIRWGVKPSTELFHGWDGSLPSLSFAKLPFLVLDKISVESMVPAKKLKEDASRADSTGYLEHGMLPVSFVEENRELAQVASMCFSMKRQLHLLYAENKVLRKAMEDMKTQFEYRGSMGPWKPPITSSGDIRIEEQTVPMRSPLLDAPKDNSSKEDTRHTNEVRKDRREDLRKDGHSETAGSGGDRSTSVHGSSDVSEELRRAIMSSKNSSDGGKSG